MKREFGTSNSDSGSQALHEMSEALLAAIVESSEDAIVSKDLTSIVTSWNHGAEMLFGYTAEEMIGKSVTLLIPSDQVDEEPAILERIRRGERIEHYQTVRRRKDGALIDVSLTVSPIKDGDGRVVGAAKIARDISDQKRSEQALRRNAETLAALVEQSPLGIYTVDADFRIRHVSVGAAPAFRNVSPIIGRDFAEVMHILWPDSFANEAISVFRRVLDTGEPYVSPGLTEQRKDLGAIESYEWQVSPVEMDDGRLGAVCYYFDVTRLQDANKALRESEERLEEEVQLRTADLLAVNEQLQGFTYSVAHDLRQQIRGISASAAMIMSDSAESLDEESQVTLGRLIDSSKKLGKLVDDLLTYARLGKTDPTRAPLDITAMSEEVAAFLIENGTCRRGTRFRIARDLVAQGDAQLIRIVLENLLNNACKYSSKSENPIIEVRQVDGEFVVQDNGIGFDMRFEPKLFQPFERLHRDSVYAGTGIGLANVRRIVERHGGKVRAVGRLGEGASFFFTLP